MWKAQGRDRLGDKTDFGELQRKIISFLSEKDQGDQAGAGQGSWGASHPTSPPESTSKAPGSAPGDTEPWGRLIIVTVVVPDQHQRNPRPGPGGGDHPHLPAGRLHLRIHGQPAQWRWLPRTLHRPLGHRGPPGGGESRAGVLGAQNCPKCPRAAGPEGAALEEKRRRSWGSVVVRAHLQLCGTETPAGDTSVSPCCPRVALTCSLTQASLHTSRFTSPAAP